MSKYLYGVSVQGIQDFIFQTNKLKEIIGASEIIKSIDKLDLKDSYNLKNKPNIIRQAAGNLVVEFEDKEDLEIVVLNFPKDIMEKAYGITVSQAVVKSMNNYKKDTLELEKRLKIQRNKIERPLDFHFSILQQNSRTALPLEDKEDKRTNQKIKVFKNYAQENAKESIFNIHNIKNSEGKIAVIHADGNGLGNMIKDMNQEEIKSFSIRLDKDTKEAFKLAKEEVKSEYNNNKKIREVILGGDDLTLICDATYALEFTQKFFKEFESKTSLTACAGISFSNEKYPIHYALKLAEDLCSHAKQHAKNINKDKAPSCLMFHNIQSSNVENFDKFIENELTINDKQLDFGPYYLNQENQPLIRNLIDTVSEFKKETSPKGKLRSWLSELHFDESYSQFQLQRINTLADENKFETKYLNELYNGLSLKNLFVEKDEKFKTPIYDILQLISIKGTENDL